MNPINEWDDGNPTGFISGCLLAYVAGWCLLCAFVTGMALASNL